MTTPIVPYVNTFLSALDIVGAFVFALSGAVAAVRRELDLFGVLVLSFLAASTGGILRDVLIGAIPPAALVDWRYLVTSVFAGLLAFYWLPLINRLQSPVQLFDAAGLALFAVTGTQKALAYGLDAPMAALLGMLTGIGGGMARDVLLREIPTVLRAELYAVAALAGACVVVLGASFDIPSALTTSAGALLCLSLRLGSIYRGWHLPQARLPTPADEKQRPRSK